MPRDRRHTAPQGYTEIEYGRIVYGRLPMSNMTRRESYCLMQYIDYLIDNLPTSIVTLTEEAQKCEKLAKKNQI